MRRQYTTDQRAQLVELVTTTGMTSAAAAAQLGVHSSTASYWVRQGRPRPRRAARSAPRDVPTPTFVQLVKASAPPPTMEVRMRRVSIHVQPGFDTALLRAIAAMQAAP